MAGTEKALSTYVLASMDYTRALNYVWMEKTQFPLENQRPAQPLACLYTQICFQVYILPSIHIALLQGDSQAQGIPHEARQGDRGRGNNSQPAEGEGLRLLSSQAWPRLSGLSQGKIYPTSFQLKSGLQGSREEGKSRGKKSCHGLRWLQRSPERILLHGKKGMLPLPEAMPLTRSIWQPRERLLSLFLRP